MIDPNKQRKVIIVHGVQVGDDDDLHQDKMIGDLFDKRVGDLNIDIEVVLYKYENLNNKILDPLQTIVKSIVSSPIGGKIAEVALDLLGDVIISLSKNKISEQIRNDLEKLILGYYELGHPCYVVGHSLGTIYSFDVINRLMKKNELFKPNNMLTWPVVSWMTLGTPLDLSMFKITGRDQLTDIGNGSYVFRWKNYYDKNDPVVSGNIFGSGKNVEEIAEKYKTNQDEQGWLINDYIVNTGKWHLAAHTEYWKLSLVGDGIIEMLTE